MKSPISKSFGSIIIVSASPVGIFLMHLELTAKPSFLNIAFEDFLYTNIYNYYTYLYKYISIEELLNAFFDLD